VRWERLFADLEASLEAEERAEFEAEVADLARAERSALHLADRIRAQLGDPLGLRLVDGDAVHGLVAEVGADWVLLTVAATAALVPLAAVVGVEGLGRAAVPPARLRLGLPVALRALARDRCYVRISLLGGSDVGGTIDRVGADHLDLAQHPADEPRRAGAVRSVRTVPLAALVAVRSPQEFDQG
jgi:hypothetical protein